VDHAQLAPQSRPKTTFFPIQERQHWGLTLKVKRMIDEGVRQAMALISGRGRVSVVLKGALAIAATIGVLTQSAHAGGAHSLFIMDANTGASLTDQDGNDPRYPASLTKMMTLYMAFDAIERGRVTMKTPITISGAATRAKPSKLDLAVGDTITMEDAIQALITKSANDIAIAVAEHIGGTEANFAKLMTAKAREIGMKNTTFRNASGLPDSSQTTTARDMVTLGLHLYDDFPRYFKLFSTRTFTYNGSTFQNHNTLMNQMPGINGIKTGYTNASGFNLVSSLELDGKHVVGAIFGGETARTRNADMKTALSKAFARASTTKTRKPILIAKSAPRPSAAPAIAAPVAAQVPRQEIAAVSPAPQPTPTPAPAPAMKAGPIVEIAKVRPVTVAQANQAAPQRQPAPQFAQASAAPKLGDVLRSKAAAAPEAAPAPTAVAQPVAPQTLPGVRPPSSLNAQFAQLTSPPQPASPMVAPQPTKLADPSYRLKGPDSAAAPTASPVAGQPSATQQGPNYDIQIGAYASPVEADRALAAALAKASAQLKGRSPTKMTVTVGDKTLYRARFSGFNQPAASLACAELTRQAINCIALKAE
jgi:D-alanyl-D-alanine carboxypeptidase